MAEVKIHYSRLNEDTNLKYKCLIYTLLLTGARISEILSLTWEDVKDTPPCLILEQSKTNDIRIAPVSKALLDILHKLPRNSGFVFSSPEGRRLDDTNINGDLKRRAKAVGIKKRVYNHLLRHSFVNIMLRSGTPIHIVSRMVGHKNIATTNEYYTHIMVEEMANYLHAYHPFLKGEQTIDIIKNRLEAFTQTLINKDKFSISIQNTAGGISIDIIENKMYKRPPLEVPQLALDTKINTPVAPKLTKKIKVTKVKRKNKNDYVFMNDMYEASKEEVDYTSFTAEKVG